MNSGIPTIFRSYHTSVNPGPSSKIWEVLRATTAHPEMFRSVEIMEHGIPQSFVDAAMGCGNPIEHVLMEAKRLYPNRRVSCIVSIGSGYPSTIRISEPSPFQRVLPINMIAAMRDIAADNERMAQTMAARFRGFPGVYFRLNVDQGMQGVQLGDWDKLGEVKAHTRAYMGKAETNELMKGVTKAVREKKGVVPVEQIDGELQAEPVQQLSGVKQCPAPTSVYTERHKPIQQAIVCLTSNVRERHIFVFHGLGGAGKTQLALGVVERTREHWSDVIYADATSAESLASTLREFAIARKIGETHEDTLRWLGSHTKPWLLVLDNADDSALDLQSYFPKGTHGRVLITTRDRDIALLAKGPDSDYNVSSMEPEESLRLLLAVARSDLVTLSNENKKAATALVQDLGHLALAVVQAGAYIRRTSCDFGQYREMYRERPQHMLEKHGQMLLKVSNYEKTVHVTWMMSYSLLSERARKMLWLMAYLQRDRITLEIFRRAALRTNSFEPTLPLNDVDRRALNDTKSYLRSFLNSDGTWDLDSFLTTITEITSCSLMSFDHANRVYEMHTLVQGWVHTVIPHSPEVALAQSTFLLTLSVNEEEHGRDYAFHRSLELHVDSVLKRQGHINLDSATYLSLVLHEVGRFEEARTFRTQVMEGAKKVLSDNHLTTLASMSRLAITYSQQGLHKEAEKLQVQVLEGMKRALGEGHPDIPTAMSNLAVTYSHQGLHMRAETLQMQVLEGRKRVLGDNHPATLTAMSNLAVTYSSRGHYKQAETLQVQALEGRQRVLGDNHPDTLAAMNNLAVTYSHQSLHKQAEMLKVQVLDGRKQLLGDDHPDTLAALSNLAVTYSHQGLHKDAEMLQVRVLEGRKRVLGDNHLDTLTAMNHLADTYSSQGLHKPAATLQVQVLDGRKRVLGNDHRDVLAAMNDLAVMYSDQGLHTQAETLKVRVLEGRKQLLGDDHSDTLTAMSNLAVTYSDQGLHQQAETLAVQVLERRKLALGDNHPDALTAMNNLANTYSSQGLHKKAETLQVQVLEGRKQTLSNDHPHTLTAMSNLAVTYSHQGLHKDAETLQVQVLDGRKRVLGDGHPDTLAAMNNLAVTYSRQGLHKQAEPLQVQVLDGRKRVLGNNHPATLTAMSNLATTYSRQRLHKQAETLQAQVREGRERALGKDHPDTLDVMKNLAVTYKHLGRGRRHQYKALKAEIAQLDPSDPPKPRRFFGLFRF